MEKTKNDYINERETIREYQAANVRKFGQIPRVAKDVDSHEYYSSTVQKSDAHKFTIRKYPVPIRGKVSGFEEEPFYNVSCFSCR